MTGRLKLVVALGPAESAALIDELFDRGHELESVASDLAERLQASRPDACLLSVSRGLSRAVVDACDGLGTRLLVFASTDAERRRAQELGIVDVLSDTTTVEEVERFLRGEIVPTRTQRQTRAPVFTVWGPTGAPGRTTIAAHLAYEFARRRRSVVLVDADPYGGALANRLGLLDEVPTFAVACRLAEAGSFTREEFDRLAQCAVREPAPVWVLTGLVRPDRWTELSETRVRAVVEKCSEWADLVIVDTGFGIECDEDIVSDLRAPRRNASTITAIDCASDVIVVGGCDPVALSRLLRANQELGALVHSQRIHPVVNAMRGSATGPGRAGQVMSTLRRFGGIRAAFLIPDDRAALDAAALAGVPVHQVNPHSPFLTGVSKLADVLVRSSGLSPERGAIARRRQRRSFRRSAGAGAQPS